MDPPLLPDETAAALGRVLRWREQLLSESDSRHRAHDYKQKWKNVLQGFEFNPQCKQKEIEKEHLSNCGKENGEANAPKLIMQRVIISGSVSEETEVHIVKCDPGSTVREFEWVSEDGFAMTHWIKEKPEEMATRERESRDDVSPHDTFVYGSDIDFMLDVGPVKLEKGPVNLEKGPVNLEKGPVKLENEPVQKDRNTKQSCLKTLTTIMGHWKKSSRDKTARDGPFTARVTTSSVQVTSYKVLPDSDTKQCSSETLQNNPSTKANCSRVQREDGSTDSEGPDNILTLHAEEIKDKSGFLEISQDLPRESDVSDRRELFTFQCLKSHIAAAVKEHVKCIEEDRRGPNIVVTFNDDMIDLVPCLQYPGRVSDEFVNRERPSGQPSKDLVKKLSEMSIHLVGIHGRFRKSFSRLESEVIRSMTKPQRICLVLLKHCAAVTGGRQHAWDKEAPLKSYELKTAMMWVCERRAPELWTWDGMLASMKAVLDYLLDCAEQGDLPCFFSREINLWEDIRPDTRAEDRFAKWSAVFRLQVLLPCAIQLLLAGLLSSSQAPLMRHLLNLPLDAQQMLWCCWKRRVDDLYPTNPYHDGKIDPHDLCCELYPAAVEGRLWSEQFLDTFRWESLPARCREPDWFAEHGRDTDSEGEEEDRKDKDGEGEEEGREDKDREGENERRKDKDGEGKEDHRKDKDEEGKEGDSEDTNSEGEEGDRNDTDRAGEEEGGVAGAMKTGSGRGEVTGTAEKGGEETGKRSPDIQDDESATTSEEVRLNGSRSLRGVSEQTPPDQTLSPPHSPSVMPNQAPSLDNQTVSDLISLDGQTVPVPSSLGGQTVSVPISLNGQTVPVSISLNGQTTPVYVSLDDSTVPVSISLNDQTVPASIILDGQIVTASISLDGQTFPVSISLDGLTVPVSISLDGETTRL
ncbi:uncharacterized protein LOC122391622 [Amphibalanus amphitrite]|uniref:uncharacterized protein LOC122391622 n=1 Tax=Amphibalanus amphitrite TaxID=1232801 RepID=UPI001C91EC9B|nr:uncharacterized protein LOC122391622 [Amphibalanus amphitrite]